jgi:hypothetical protein
MTIIPIVVQFAIWILYIVLINKYAHDVRYFGYIMLFLMLLCSDRETIESEICNYNVCTKKIKMKTYSRF